MKRPGHPGRRFFMNDRGLGEAEQLRLGGGAFPNLAKQKVYLKS
jgi:hypothetical protein